MAHLWGAAGACQAACASARRFHRTPSIIYPTAARYGAADASGKGLARFLGNGYMSLIERSL